MSLFELLTSLKRTVSTVFEYISIQLRIQLILSHSHFYLAIWEIFLSLAHSNLFLFKAGHMESQKALGWELKHQLCDPRHISRLLFGLLIGLKWFQLVDLYRSIPIETFFFFFWFKITFYCPGHFFSLCHILSVLFFFSFFITINSSLGKLAFVLKNKTTKLSYHLQPGPIWRDRWVIL